jgi:hypothetical protein
MTSALILTMSLSGARENAENAQFPHQRETLQGGRVPLTSHMYPQKDQDGVDAEFKDWKRSSWLSAQPLRTTGRSDHSPGLMQLAVAR